MMVIRVKADSQLLYVIKDLSSEELFLLTRRATIIKAEAVVAKKKIKVEPLLTSKLKAIIRLKYDIGI